MTFTHAELSNAVREAGRDGQAFSSAAVRSCLGLTTRDRGELTRFQNRFRAFQKAAPDEIEKLGNNSYRLKQIDHARPSEIPASETGELEPAADSSVALPVETALLFASVQDDVECEGPAEPTSFFETARERNGEPMPSLGAVQQAALRTWRERSQWLGKRFAELFGRA